MCAGAVVQARLPWVVYGCADPKAGACDTLYRIALENGQNYRDIAAWNNLANPSQIEVDQLLRVVPPGANAAAITPGVATAPITGGAVQAAPLSSTPAPSANANVPSARTHSSLVGENCMS